MHEHENQDAFKAEIKAWLKKNKMKRKEFAEKCYVSPNTVRNWLAQVHIPKDKEAIIRYMIDDSQREEKLRKITRANWRPFAVMVNAEDYNLIANAAREDNMTVEEWSERTLIQDAEERMTKALYPASLLIAEDPVPYGPKEKPPAPAPSSAPRRRQRN